MRHGARRRGHAERRQLDRQRHRTAQIDQLVRERLDVDRVLVEAVALPGREDLVPVEPRYVEPVLRVDAGDDLVGNDRVPELVRVDAVEAEDAAARVVAGVVAEQIVVEVVAAGAADPKMTTVP